MKLLRHRADRWPVAYTLGVLAVQLAIFFAIERPWLAALAVTLLLPVQAVAIACNHYQHHQPAFTRKPLNRLYELILFLQTGTPPYLITLHHNLGHHRHYKCGHRPRNPPWVKLLQRAGLVLSVPHHVRHHSGNHDVNYCIVNGWADRTLGRLGLFRGLEWAIRRATGARPQRDDHEWFRRYGRPVVGRGGLVPTGDGEPAP